MFPSVTCQGLPAGLLPGVAELLSKQNKSPVVAGWPFYLLFSTRLEKTLLYQESTKHGNYGDAENSLLATIDLSRSLMVLSVNQWQYKDLGPEKGTSLG